MTSAPRSVDEAIARFDDLIARYDGASGAAGAARRRHLGRSARSAGRRAANATMVVAALVVATIGFGLIVGPIGIAGLFGVAVLIVAMLVLFAVWPAEHAAAPAYSATMSNREVVSRFDSYLHRNRAALPSPAASRVDSIASQLPMLESRLGEMDTLDPLAQDARRLMGQHIPDLIDRYERIPLAHRHDPDSGGMTADERLVTALDAAHEALDDLARRATRQDRDAFETQGRFIESRYKNPDKL